MSAKRASIELIQTLIDLENTGIPLEDFGNALQELSLLDQFTGLNLSQEFTRMQRAPFGLHGINHTIRVVFWVLYLVEISNRLGYTIREDEALAVLYAALVHDLCRQDDLPGGQHGRDAANLYQGFLREHLLESELRRCITAIECHGFAQDPPDFDPVWMLLKDADALDRARLAPPGQPEGCDPLRLRLPVLRENTPVLDACLTISLLLLELLTINESNPEIFRTVTLNLVDLLRMEMMDQPEVFRQAAHLITDRFRSE